MGTIIPIKFGNITWRTEYHFINLLFRYNYYGLYKSYVVIKYALSLPCRILKVSFHAFLVTRQRGM